MDGGVIVKDDAAVLFYCLFAKFMYNVGERGIIMSFDGLGFISSVVSSMVASVLLDSLKNSDLTQKGHDILPNGELVQADTISSVISEVQAQKCGDNDQELVEKIVSRYKYELETTVYPTDFAKHFDYILFLMNRGRTQEKKISLARLADFLGYPSPNELKQYYQSNKEPDFEEVKDIAAKLGINEQWLCYGEDVPFERHDGGLYRAYDIWKAVDQGDVLDKKTAEIVFGIEYCPTARHKEYRRNIGIFIKVNEYKYISFKRGLLFHTDVGGGGTKALMSLLSLRKSWRITMPSVGHF